MRITKLREERGYSSYKLAEKSGLNVNTINNLYRRKNSPSLSTLNSICNGLDCSLVQFFSEDDEEAVYLTESQKELINSFSKLDEDKKKAILDLIRE